MPYQLKAFCKNTYRESAIYRLRIIFTLINEATSILIMGAHEEIMMSMVCDCRANQISVPFPMHRLESE